MRLTKPLAPIMVFSLLGGLSGCGSSGVDQAAPEVIAPTTPSPAPVAPPALVPTPVPVPTPVVSKNCDAYVGTALAELKAFEGAMHEHSSYSDGDITKIPADYFATIKENGYSFAGSSEHSDTLDAGNFLSVGSDCFSTPDGFLTCLTPSTDELAKWTAVEGQAATVSDAIRFLGIRGFEWTSDRFGHINVYFSQNFTNAKTDGGFVGTMETFWSWLARDPAMPGLSGSVSSPTPMGGGADGLAHFNHPGDKCLSADDPGCDWNQYALIPAVVPQMFGMEVYNPANNDDRYAPFYARALDAGWKLAPIGSEDEHALQYGSEDRAKTVTYASALTAEAFKEAWSARRVMALSPGMHLRGVLLADGDHPMGSSLGCTAGSTVPMTVKLTQKDGSAYTGEYRLFTNTGEQVATITGESAHFDLTAPTAGETRWFYVRAHGGADHKSVAYFAPIWITGKP